MKPTVTIDERGVLLHVTDAAGNGYAIPLEPATVIEMAAALSRAKAALKTPEGRSVLVSALGGLLRELTKPKE